VDGELVPDIKLKEQVVIAIRRFRPDIVFTMDPSFFYYKSYGFVNHSDHRAIGEATLDACYPLARDLLSFPEHAKAGLKPHKVKEVLLHSFVPENANFYVDVTETFDLKIKGPLPPQIPGIRPGRDPEENGGSRPGGGQTGRMQVCRGLRAPAPA
jgi:LmbE family N-acetylglucosaminyl deacetylase